MPINVIKPGLYTSIQDTGRRGYYHLGIPPSGGMDQRALRAANLLLDNPEDAAVLECALMGPTLEFTESRCVAACGAAMTPRVNGREHPLNEVFRVPAGARLDFEFVKAGARLYLAIEGGIDVPVRLGSRSTYTLGSLGGLEGRTLRADDCLALLPVTGAPREGRRLPNALTPTLGAEWRLRVVPGLYDHRLVKDSRERFYAEKWQVASEADRIGYRLKGGTRLSFIEREPLFGAGEDPSNIVDACYPIGSIQVPSGSEPIILHRDAVSGGGYAMIGTVISADMDLIGQMQPHQHVQFVAVSLEEALKARHHYLEQLAALRRMP